MSSGEKVIVPTSTGEYQIFPLGCCSSNYNTGDYDPEFADGKVTHKEITQVIDDIQRSQQPAVRKRWLLEFLMFWIYFILIIIVVILRYIFFGLNSLLGWFVMFVVLSLCSGVINEAHEKRLSDIAKESKDVCYKMLDEKHKGSFEAKGLRWFLPTHFPLWVELQKIHNHAGQNTAQPIYIPPNQHQQPNLNDMNAQV